MNCPQNAKKRSLFARKNGRKAPQREKYLISGFGHLRCSALENSGSKSPQTRMKPEKNGTTSILSSLHGPPRGIRTPDLQNRNLTLYPAALWAEMRFSYYNAAKMVGQDGGDGEDGRHIDAQSPRKLEDLGRRWPRRGSFPSPSRVPSIPVM